LLLSLSLYKAAEKTGSEIMSSWQCNLAVAKVERIVLF